MQHDTRCACKVLRIRHLVTWPGTMAGRRLREHFAAAVLCYASEERKGRGGGGKGGGGGDGTKPSLRLYRSCPRPAPPTMNPANASLAVDPNPHDAVGLCYLSTGCRIARTIKLSGEQGVREPRRGT